MRGKLVLITCIWITGFSFAQSKENTNQIVEIYLEIKASLVSSDFGLTVENSTKLVKVIGPTDVLLLNEISADAKNIQGAKDLKEQRGYFKHLSEGIYELVKSEGPDTTLYWQYCPMALNYTGAYWISASSEITNPYFGDTMLRCGSTKEVIE